MRLAAVVAALGSLLSLLLGVSRTTLAMARDGHLPRTLSAVHPRFRVPHHAEIAVGAVVLVVVAPRRRPVSDRVLLARSPRLLRDRECLSPDPSGLAMVVRCRRRRASLGAWRWRSHSPPPPSWPGAVVLGIGAARSSSDVGSGTGPEPGGARSEPAEVPPPPKSPPTTTPQSPPPPPQSPPRRHRRLGGVARVAAGPPRCRRHHRCRHPVSPASPPVSPASWASGLWS